MLSPLIGRYYIWIWGGCLAALLASVVAMVKAYVDSRRASYLFLREEAATKARRAAIVTFFLLAINVGMALRLPKEAPSPVAVATPTLTPTPTLAPSPTFTPRPTATPTPTLMPTSTFTPSPTVKLPTSARTPIPGASTPEPGASFGKITLAKGVTEDNLPLEPCTLFPEGTRRVYAFFEYSGMTKGVAWTQAWYREGDELWSHTKKWRLREQGIAWVYFEPSRGFSVGEYEVRLYIGQELQQRATFTLR